MREEQVELMSPARRAKRAERVSKRKKELADTKTQ
jgi:hypothetical protein